MIKKWIIKLFKINIYEEEYQDALTDIEVIISVAKNYKRELENLKASFNDNMVEEIDEETFKAFCEENEIKIDDLIEGTDNEDLDREQSVRITQYAYHPNEKIKTRIWLVKQQNASKQQRVVGL